MLSWVFKHRDRLAVVYGVAPALPARPERPVQPLRGDALVPAARPTATSPPAR